MIDQRGLKVAVTLPSRGEREVLNELPFEIALFGHWNDHIGSSSSFGRADARARAADIQSRSWLRYRSTNRSSADRSTSGNPPKVLREKSGDAQNSASAAAWRCRSSGEYKTWLEQPLGAY